MIMCFIVSFTLSNCTQKLADAQREGAREGGRESGRRRERERVSFYSCMYILCVL